MAGYNLYLKLMSGEVVHVTDAWDGAAPTEEGMVDADGVAVDANGKEVSEAYRDIHRHTASIYPAAGSYAGSVITTSAPVTVAAALVPTELVTVEEAYYLSGGIGVTTVKSAVPDGFSTSPSDEVAHKKPRQFAKVYTWLIFAEDPSGPVHKWRKSEVMGWGKMPPIDI